MVDGARSVLNDLLADVYIFTDHMTGPEAGQSPGYGLMLVAETTTGCFISSECTANAALKVVVPILLCSLELLVHLTCAANRHVCSKRSLNNFSCRLLLTLDTADMHCQSAPVSFRIVVAPQSYGATEADMFLPTNFGNSGLTCVPNTV